MKKVNISLRNEIIQHLEKLKRNNFSDPQSLLGYARFLLGMSFNQMLDLGIKERLPENTYGNKKRKGGPGNLVEEHYFGYSANSDSEPDFVNAGIELKVSPIEKYTPKRGENKGKETIKAGERLVLSMIPNNKEIAADYADSDLRKKTDRILLINYLRDRELDTLEQEIVMANLFSPSAADQKIIEDDYRIISQYIREGRAHELSEGLTKYLGACTKGATAEKSFRKQFYPFVHEDGTEEYIPAKSRAFSLKQSYMTAVVQKFKHEQDAADRLLSNSQEDDFESAAEARIGRYVGRTSESIRAEVAPDLKLVTPKNGINKAGYRQLVMHMLEAPTGRIEEFEKADICVRVVRLNKKGRPAEDIKLGIIQFSELTDGTEWEESSWYEMLTVPRYMFVVFQENEAGNYELRGSTFWRVPMRDVGGESSSRCVEETALGYWKDTQQKLREGVKFAHVGGRWNNNFLNPSEHPVCHLRPSAQKAAYKFHDGTIIGDVKKDADALPDGRFMTRQALWLSKDYISSAVYKLAR